MATWLEEMQEWDAWTKTDIGEKFKKFEIHHANMIWASENESVSIKRWNELNKKCELSKKALIKAIKKLQGYKLVDWLGIEPHTAEVFYD